MQAGRAGLLAMGARPRRGARAAREIKASGGARAGRTEGAARGDTTRRGGEGAPRQRGRGDREERWEDERRKVRDVEGDGDRDEDDGTRGLSSARAREMEFFTIIIEKSSSRQVLPDNFVKMLDGHRPQNMKLRQAGNGLRKLWDLEVVFDTDGSMYDGNTTFTMKVFDTTMCQRRYQDDDDAKMEFFTIILEKSSSRKVLPDNFVKMLDGHRPQNMKLRQAGYGLRKLWDVEVVFDTDGSMYLDRGWWQFVRAYDLRHGYFLVFTYDDNATFVVKVFDTTMCRRRYQDDDDASNGSRSTEYCDRCYVYGSSDSGYRKSSSDSGYSRSSSDDGLAMIIPQLGDRAMPIVVEEYIPQPGLRLRRSKRIRMMKEKVKKQE
ncbi:B3 domain-containing protein [Hordeum vulgare]|nr:B3 domain-containing protein [Hordeum vulgare]